MSQKKHKWELRGTTLISQSWYFSTVLIKFPFTIHCRFQLRGPLIIWNTLLAMFSIMGAARTAPELIHVLRHYGLFHSVCVPRLVLCSHLIEIRSSLSIYAYI